MNYFYWFDQVRYVPVLNLVTLWCFAVDSMRYSRWINRAIRMFFTFLGCTILSGLICGVFSWAPGWFLCLCITSCLYGTVVAVIVSVRDEIMNLHRQSRIN